MPTTYEPIATTTLGSTATSITFSSIASSWTDLRLVFMPKTSAGLPPEIRVNSDTGSNYSRTMLYGNGTSTGSGRDANQTNWGTGSQSGVTDVALITLDLFSYAGSTNKTGLITFSNDRNGAGSVERSAVLWRSTSAITSITMTVDLGAASFAAGTTATLYGIKAA